MPAKPAAVPANAFASDLRFRVNGADVVIADVDPSVLLVDWLRSPAVGLTGTKKSCAQGGCGACTVMLSRWDETLSQVEHLAINSCLRPLCSLDGMEITTTEGTGSCRSGISPVQYRIAKDIGSQCGFCTPGFVMNMHAFLVANQGRPLEQLQIENIFDGNLCRCTGYRPILYAMRHFATGWGPADEEGCLHTVVDPADKPPCADIEPPPPPPRQPPRAVHYAKGGYHWYRPTSLQQVHDIIGAHDLAEVKLVGGNTSIGIYDRFVENPHILIDISQLPELHGIKVDDGGLTIGAAVTYGRLLQELDWLIAEPPTGPTVERLPGLQALQYMTRRTAGTIVRNAATLAGNTMLVARHVAAGEPFPSDLFTALCSLGARVRVSVAGKNAIELPILEFVQKYQTSPDLRAGVLVNYLVPWTRAREYARTYKAALREVNAHAIVNGGLRARFADDGTVEDAAVVLGGIGPVAFHAVSAERYLSGRQWNAATLQGALPLVRADVEENLRENRERMSGLVFEGFTDEYRTHLAESYFYQFFVHVLEQVNPASVPPDVRSAGIRVDRPVSKGKESYKEYPDEYPVNQPIVKLGAFLQATGEAAYTHDMALPPRGYEAALVTSAQALATIGYRIPAGKGFTKVDIDGLIAYLRANYAEFVDYVTARDIPKGGSNGSGNKNPDYVDPIFVENRVNFSAENRVTSFGQCIGLVLATVERAAIDIAEFISTVCIEYTSDGPLILTIEEARRADAIFPDAFPFPVHIWKIERPKSDLAWKDAPGKAVVRGVPCTVVTGTQQSGAQLHFYMETQACVAIPAERNEIVIHPSSQSPDGVHNSVRSTLNIPAAQVDVKILRVGGGYGGKTTRSPWVASAVAVAAWKHFRPVKLAMRRENDSAMVGHRHPLYGEYAVAIGTGDDNPEHRGRLMGMSTDFYSDGGATYDCSFIVMDCIQLRCDSAYMVPNYQTSGDVCRTNKASNGAFRSMGLVQGLLVQEDAIEKASHAVGMLAEEVRGKNLYRQGEMTPFGQVVDYCYLDRVWERIGAISEFDRRRLEVEKFNKANRWRKRGISMIPVKYGSGYNATFLEQAGALVDVNQEDGSVLLHHGGVEMGQGLVTKVAQIAAKELNLPLELIHTTATDTQIIPNPISTGASTGAAFNGGAVMEACRMIRSQLETYCLKLLHEHGPQWCRDNGINFWDYKEGWQVQATVNGRKKMMWCFIVASAYNACVNLSAQVRFKQQGGEAIDTGLIFKPSAEKGEVVNHFTGFTYSAACTEVEIDVLTGETTVLRADVLYDMGKSLNPAIDIGQVEGAYIQGLGYVLTEGVVFQPDGPNKGELNTDNTWYYKIPATTTIPLEFNVHLFPMPDPADVPEDPYDLMSSKEVGEPPLVLAVTAYFAVKHAVLAARKDRGHDEWFFLEAPATVQRIREACLVSAADLRV
jgi:xanthine dehydrogenase/oxidase